MGLVVHVIILTVRSDGTEFTTRLPFEPDAAYGFEDVEDMVRHLDSGLSVGGLRLWLDRPVRPEDLGLAYDPDLAHLPHRARAVIQEEEFRILPRQVQRIDPWTAGRIVRYEEA